MNGGAGRDRTPLFQEAVRFSRPQNIKPQNNGGAGRDRTDDLKLAKLPLSQLSYGPLICVPQTPGAQSLR